MAWLTEHDPIYIIAAALLLGVVILAAFVAWRQSSSGGGFFSARDRRLGVVEYASVDGRRKLLLVRRDNVEHLVMIGGPIDVILETGIERAPRRTATLASEDAGASLYSNGRTHISDSPSQTGGLDAFAPSPTHRVNDAAERIASFPFKDTARRLFSKLSMPALAQPPAQPDFAETADDHDQKRAILELGDEREAEKLR